MNAGMRSDGRVPSTEQPDSSSGSCCTASKKTSLDKKRRLDSSGSSAHGAPCSAVTRVRRLDDERP